MRLSVALLLAFVLLVSAAVDAQTGQGWREYSPSQRYEALRNYRQHNALPTDRRETVERNYERWRSMPESERQRMRQNYQRFQNLPPEQRNKLTERYRAQPKR